MNDRSNPPGTLADAELHFADGVLAGLAYRLRHLGASQRHRPQRDAFRAAVQHLWRGRLSTCLNRSRRRIGPFRSGGLFSVTPVIFRAKRRFANSDEVQITVAQQPRARRHGVQFVAVRAFALANEILE